jgi:predicted O-methyltransferase YrrM
VTGILLLLQGSRKIVPLFLAPFHILIRLRIANDIFCGGKIDTRGLIPTIVMREVKNILKNAARLGAGRELVRKAVGKYLEPEGKTEEVQEWCALHASDIRDWIRPEESQLWEDALEFAEKLRRDAQDTLEGLGVQLGGGGHYGLLYFLTRKRRPEVVVETGVAAGFSSKAVLSAMAENGRGHLYSSDFPYCRLKQPEKYIGALVDLSLRSRWTLHIKGDRANLPTIAESLEAESISLFHYDSDKSYSGRDFAYQTLQPYLAHDSICVFDDIQNNWHFRDLSKSGRFDWKVFEFGGKYLGLLQKVRLEQV